MTTKKAGTFELLGRVWNYEILDEHGLTRLCRTTTRSRHFWRTARTLTRAFALGGVVGVASILWAVSLCGF